MQLINYLLCPFQFRPRNLLLSIGWAPQSPTALSVLIEKAATSPSRACRVVEHQLPVSPGGGNTLCWTTLSMCCPTAAYETF